MTGRADDRVGAERWWELSGGAWRRLRALPAWAQAVLWLLLWPAVVALYVARDRRLGPLLAPLTATVLLCGGMLWWLEPLLAQDGVPVAGHTVERSGAGPDGLGAVALPGGEPEAAALAELDPSTLEVGILECVQTRSYGPGEQVLRQPRIKLRIINHGPPRTAVLHGAVLLDAYDWNRGWKPAEVAEVALDTGDTARVTLMPAYRHQASYTRDGLRACRVGEVELRAARVWPEHPTRRVSSFRHQVMAAAERDLSPVHDRSRTDAR